MIETKDTKDPKGTKGTKGAKVGIGVLGLLAAGVVAAAGAAFPPQPPASREVAIVAERFDFSPSRITVPAGTTLEIEVTSEDTLHGFRIQGTEVNVAVPKRGRGAVRVTFRADKPGRYTFECSRMCGAGHNFMRGEIRVTEASGQ